MQTRLDDFVPHIGLIVLIGGLSAMPQTAIGQARWVIEPHMRIGTVEEGPASFADIRGVVVGPNGAVWVLEFKSQEIRMFDSAGRFIKIVARSGSGPGEIRRANGMLMSHNGEVWVNDPANGRLTVFTSDGQYKAQYVLKGGGAAYHWSAMIDTAGRVNEEIRVRTAKGAFVPGVRRVAPNGSVLDTLPMPLCTTRGVDTARAFFGARTPAGDNVSMGVPFLPRSVMAWNPRGAVWCSGGDRYEVVQITLGNVDTTVRIVHRSSPVEVTPDERMREIALVHERFAALGFADPDFSWIPRTKPIIVALDTDDTGRLWVRRSVRDTNTTAFDVWNTRGEFLATALAPFRISPFWHPLIRGDTVYAVRMDADEVPYVVRALIRQ
jgi:hypothetical protein